MTTVNYSVEQNVAAGYVKVEWPSMAHGDDGQPFDCSGLRLSSIQYFGSFAGGQAVVQASNEISPSTFITIDNASSNVFRFPSLEGGDFLFPPTIRPVVSGGGGGDVSVAVLLVARH